MKAGCTQEKEDESNSPADSRVVVIKIELLYTRAYLSDDQNAYWELVVGIHDKQNNIKEMNDSQN